MTELFVILVATVLVNNFVLMRFLGLCPFMGVSRNLEAATGMSLATAFVLTLSSATAYLLHVHVIVPLDLGPQLQNPSRGFGLSHLTAAHLRPSSPPAPAASSLRFADPATSARPPPTDRCSSRPAPVPPETRSRPPPAPAPA